MRPVCGSDAAMIARLLTIFGRHNQSKQFQQQVDTPQVFLASTGVQAAKLQPQHSPDSQSGKIELEDFILEVKAIIARPPLLASTTLQDLGQNAKRQRTKIALSSSALNVKWDDKLWEYVAVSTGLPEKDDGDRDGLQSIFTRLMKAPPPTRLSSCTMSIDAVLCVEMTSSLILMSLRHKPMVPMTTRLVLHLKHQDSQCDSSKNIGKAITYGRMCLQQLPRTLRSTVLVGLTDLQTITLIRVTLPMQPDQEASPSVQPL